MASRMAVQVRLDDVRRRGDGAMACQGHGTGFLEATFTIERLSSLRHGAAAALVERVELLLVLDRVHRLPEALVGVGDQLFSLDQALEGLLHELLAGVDVVEHVPPKDEEPAVDPDVRLLDVLDRVNNPVLRRPARRVR